MTKQIRSAYKKEEKRKLLRVNDRVSSFTFTYISSRIQSQKKKTPILLKTKSTVRIVYKFYNNSAPRQIRRNCQMSNHYVESLGYRSNLTRPNLVGFLPSTSVYICHIYKAPGCSLNYIKYDMQLRGLLSFLFPHMSPIKLVFPTRNRV